MTRAQRIERLLTDALAPERIEIVDESDLHAGHAGAREGGETHYRILVVADIFHDENRVARQRRINAALDGEFADGLHALSIRAMTPKEFSSLNST